MHPDEIHMDGIERRFVGPHCAVLLRINHNLIRSIMAVRVGRDNQELEAVRDKQPVKLRRAA